MSHDSCKIHYDELNVLINLIPERKWVISYPLYDFEMIKVCSHTKGYRLEIKNDDRFDEFTSKFNEYRKEVPGYNGLRSAMLSSGVLEIANIGQVREEVERYNKSKSGVRFALDTNLLYDNFVRNHEVIDAQDVILVDTVKEEIKNKANKKYGKNDIRSLKILSPRNEDLFDELWNKRIKKSRTASLAMMDWVYLVDNDARVIETDIDPSSEEGGADRIIVERLKDQDDNISQFLVVMTADDAMIDLCKIENMEYIKCDLEHQVSSTICDFKSFRNLLFDMARIFGFIKFGPVIIFGEYRGYTSNQPNLLKVKTQNRRLFKELERDLDICRKLDELDIEK